MKTEGEFNAFLSKEFKKRRGIVPIKTADKYRSGLSDFIILCDKNTVGIESKFSTKQLGGAGSLITHPFSPVQLTFLHRIGSVGCGAYGLVGVKEEKVMYLVHYRDIPKTGWVSYDIMQASAERFIISPAGVAAMCTYLFGEQ